MSQHQRRQELSQKLSQQTLALIGELGVNATPTNYAIFYTYLEKSNPDLMQTVDILRSNNRDFDDLQCQELYERFFENVREREIVGQLTSDLRTRLNGVIDTVRQAGIDTRAYGQALDHFCEYIDGKDLSNLEHALKAVLGATRTMENVNGALGSKLDQTSNEVSKLRHDLEEMKREALTDGLTGIANRKAFDQNLRDAAMGSMEKGQDLCLLLIDIDLFKNFNDTHGHLAGDQVIRLMAQTLQKNVTERDTAARYGGEEFAVILPQTNLQEATVLAERIRRTVERSQVVSKIRHQALGQVTVSIGVGAFAFGEPLARLIERTDTALYQAKSNGRNRVVTEQNIAKQEHPLHQPA